MMTKALEAARLMDTDEPVGVHAWPLACYVTEAVENEMDAFSIKEKANPSYDNRFRLALRRAINMSASYAEQWGLDIDVFRFACEMRSI